MTVRGILPLLFALLISTPTQAVTVVARNHGAAAPGIVVVLDPLDPGVPESAAPRSATIDQVNRQFVPMVSVVRIGTAVDFPNSDRIRHHVYSFSQAKKFSLKLYSGRPSSPVLFDQPGVVVLGCNIHDSMVGFLAVVESPYFAQTGADGRAVVQAPAGRYRLRVWHPGLRARVPSRVLTLDAGSAEVHVDVDLGDGTQLNAPWPDA